MFQIEHPDDYLDRLASERGRIEERNRLVRALRGSTPPFSETTERELRTVMRSQLEALAHGGR